MEIEYNKILFAHTKRPSGKYILVAIPLNMYRVETNGFRYGINFFQKTVLKLKAKAGISNIKIAGLLGLDVKLIELVTSQLQNMRLINEFGSLTPDGKEKLYTIDKPVINPNKKQTGYVFKYANEDKAYPYYVHQITPADTTLNKEKHPQIITGTRGDGEDYTDNPFYLDKLYTPTIAYPAPREREILQLIKNTAQKTASIQAEGVTEDTVMPLLGIRLLNEQPEKLWACTYIYLKKNEDDTYDPDWRVLDPFSPYDNIALKFYLINSNNKALLDNISKKFADARTIGGKMLEAYQNHLDDLVNVQILNDFPSGLHSLDSNLQQYIKSVIRNYILLQNQHFNNLDTSLAFSLNLQNTFETIFKIDKEQRATWYQQVYIRLDDDFIKKKSELIGFYRHKLFGDNIRDRDILITICKGKLEKGNSLLSYLVSCMLTYKYDNKSKLFEILPKRIDKLIEISKLRNEKGHGQTSQEKNLTPMPKEKAEELYLYVRSFINDLIRL